MRIEGTQTFLASMDPVFAVCTDPDLVRRSIPGCERLIQFGPAAPDEAINWEARLRLGPDAQVYTAAVTLQPLRQPARLEIAARGRGPHGDFTGRGSLDFVEQDGRTVVAYVWTLESETIPESERQATDSGAATQLAQTIGERLAAAVPIRGDGQPTYAEALPLLRADTARGKIILLPPTDGRALAPRVRVLVQRGALVAAGLAVGLAALALAGAIIRRWGTPRSLPPEPPAA